jgi:AbrB family looped-hinge helix DNA binding protein
MPRLVKMDARGRVTLPKALRTVLKISSGDRLTFSQLDDGTVVFSPKSVVLPEPARMVTKPGQPEAIGEGANKFPITKR